LPTPHLGASAEAIPPPRVDAEINQRIARLEAEMASLTNALQELRTRVELLEPNT